MFWNLLWGFPQVIKNAEFTVLCLPCGIPNDITVMASAHKNGLSDPSGSDWPHVAVCWAACLWFIQMLYTT